MARTRIVIGGMTWDYGPTTKDGPGGACDANPVLTRPSMHPKGGLW